MYRDYPLADTSAVFQGLGLAVRASGRHGRGFRDVSPRHLLPVGVPLPSTEKGDSASEEPETQG